MTITLSIPESLAYRLIYRQERLEPFEVVGMDGFDFRLLSRIGDAHPFLSAFRRRYGFVGSVKTLLKLATSRRELYCVLWGDRIVHDGWLMISYCAAYPVEKDAVVIGPMNTDARWRGKGIAPHALKMAMNVLWSRGHRIFYINTAHTNVASQRAIAKSEFGSPVSVYITGQAVRRCA